MAFMRNLRRSLLTVLTLLSVSPLFAYTIFLKDGSSIQSKEKYTISGDRAVIILPNGTETFVPAKKIDVARTDQANVNDYGSAVVIDDTHQAPQQAQPAPAPKKTLADLIQNKTAVPRPLPQARRETHNGTNGASAVPGVLSKTKAGFLDLSTATRKPFAQADVITELQQFFHSQGVEEVEIYQGTSGDRPLIEVTTNSEGAVFRSLAVGATALLRLRDKHPGIGSCELLLMTPGKERAGQFVLTPQLAADIVSKNVEVSAFYLDHVQF
ncbi:MAG TPA: hypothetical protein VFE33_22175 [Thermoanaerobaculia bacterium]|nr:hypothetical protein [Thermoanaerobaculia bacterium]